MRRQLSELLKPGGVSRALRIPRRHSHQPANACQKCGRELFLQSSCEYRLARVVPPPTNSLLRQLHFLVDAFVPPTMLAAMAAAAAQRLLAATMKIIGVGRNYIAHAKELGNPVPKVRSAAPRASRPRSQNTVAPPTSLPLLPARSLV